MITLKTLLIAAMIVVIGLGTYLWVVVKPRFGNPPAKSEVKKFYSSPQFNSEKNLFQNVHSKLMEDLNENMDMWDTTKKWLFNDNQTTPKKRLPEVQPDIKSFLAPESKIKFIWLGHSSFLLRIENKTILIAYNALRVQGIGGHGIRPTIKLSIFVAHRNIPIPDVKVEII